MRILLVSYHFAPYNTMGAVRTSKTAKYLVRAGHSVRVVSARSQGLPETLALEIAEEAVSWTPWIGVRRRPKLSFGAQIDAPPLRSVGRAKAAGDLAYMSAKWCARNLLYTPDREIGWFPFAAREATAIVARERFDVVFASAPPYTALLVGAWVAERANLPLVCELRDLWTDCPRRYLPLWASRLDASLERLALSSAAGLVVVSDEHADILKQRYSRPVAVVQNGFDPEDSPTTGSPSHKGNFEVVYTGTLYEGLSDPSPLLEAADALEHDGIRISVHFYGSDSHLARQRARLLGFERFVVSHAAVPHRDALQAQANADALLLLDQGERTAPGVATGKLFEYIGSRRPILVLSAPDYTAARVVLEQGLGRVTRDPSEIARFLRMLHEQKERDGYIANLDTDTSPYTRARGVETLTRFLEQIVPETPTRGGIRN